MDGYMKNQLKRLSNSKEKMEHTHKRRTFLVRNDLIAELDGISKDKHGFKTEFINLAIENALDEYHNTVSKSRKQDDDSYEL